MKIFSLLLTRYKLLVLITLCILEIISFIIIFIKYKPIYLKIFERIKKVPIEKAISITNSINEAYKMTFIRNYLDMKFIGKHMSLLANNEINPSSKYYENIVKNEDKKIIYGTIEELKKNFSEYYDINTNKFLFLDNYNKKYTNDKNDNFSILNELTNNSLHQELNCISFYKVKGNISYIESNLKKKIAAKYLISILKTNFLNRYLSRGEEYEFIHYFLLIDDEIYIYPPEAYNNTIIYSIKENHNCGDSFPECFYNDICDYMYYVSFYLETFENIYPIFPFSILLDTNFFIIQCLSVPFGEKIDPDNIPYSPKICIEMNMTKVFSQRLFKTKEKFNFIFFFQFDIDLAVLYNDNFEQFSEIKKVYNDPKYKEYYFNKYNDYFYLFQFLYLDLFKEPSLLKEHNISLEDIFEEYKIIRDKINEGINMYYDIEENYFVIEVEKTICKSDIYNNGKKCIKDNIILVVIPLSNIFTFVDKNYIDDDFSIYFELYYSMTIIYSNYNYFKWKINHIMIIKILKLFLFIFIISIFLIFLIFILVQIFFEYHFNILNKILQIIKGGSLFEIKDKNEIIQKKEKIPVKAKNKEMLEIKNLFDYLIKTQLLQINFEENEHNLNKNISKSEENINNNNTDCLNDYMILIKNMNNEEITIMFSFIIAYEHFKKGLYKLSENELKDLIKEFHIYENKISTSLENDNSNLKDSISRCSKISYLNEYSLTNELSESIIHLIKVKLLSQKIYYLYALSLFNKEKLNENKNKKYNNNKENNKNYEEAIKYFIESKKISVLLGIDTIRLIFSLIMISKCYLELKNYKESMLNINEALLFLSDIKKAFKDKQYFNPKVMMFTENYIFQSIVLTIAKITFNFGKYYESCWILMKIIETSPFVFDNLHFQVCYLLTNCLNKIDNMKDVPFRQIDKYQNKINKIFARINARLFNKKGNIKSDKYTNNSIILNNQINNMSISDNIINTSKSKHKLPKNKEIYSKYSNKKSLSINSFFHIQRNRNKNIILCISEKYIKHIKGDEFKYIIIKFMKKFFNNNKNEDKFSFIQFSYNGKKTISIKSNSLRIFLQKLESNKIAFKVNDGDFNQNNANFQFSELSNLFMSIIKSHKKINNENKDDNIIILFINTSDIRFNGQKECVDTINELNNNNYSVIIFTYDFEITEEKIEGIYSFMNGLNDGHFFRVKNYQQIKQVLMNFSGINIQEKFNNYNYEITDYML